MTVDHFRPECRFPELRLTWSNLYYACSICNSHYKKDHPTPEEEAQGKRFVDPCEEDPDQHFRLTPDFCQVRALSPVAEYVVFRLKLNHRKSLRDFWRSLHHEESRLLRREGEIRHGLEDCARVIRPERPSAELQRVQAVLELLLNETRSELDGVRRLRPFPVD
jgi:hypothetical protein